MPFFYSLKLLVWKAYILEQKQLRLIIIKEAGAHIDDANSPAFDGKLNAFLSHFPRALSHFAFGT